MFSPRFPGRRTWWGRRFRCCADGSLRDLIRFPWWKIHGRFMGMLMGYLWDSRHIHIMGIPKLATELYRQNHRTSGFWIAVSNHRRVAKAPWLFRRSPNPRAQAGGVGWSHRRKFNQKSWWLTTGNRSFELFEFTCSKGSWIQTRSHDSHVLFHVSFPHHRDLAN